MPWMKEGEEFETDENGRYSKDTPGYYSFYMTPKELADLVKNGWIEEVNDRIELGIVGYNGNTGAQNMVFKKSLEPLIKKEIKLMEQAINLPDHLKKALINGELFTKEDMAKFGKYVDRTDNFENIYTECFNDWLKDKQKKP